VETPVEPISSKCNDEAFKHMECVARWLMWMGSEVRDASQIFSAFVFSSFVILGAWRLRRFPPCSHTQKVELRSARMAAILHKTQSTNIYAPQPLARFHRSIEKSCSIWRQQSFHCFIHVLNLHPIQKPANFAALG